MYQLRIHGSISDKKMNYSLSKIELFVHAGMYMYMYMHMYMPATVQPAQQRDISPSPHVYDDQIR